MSRIALIDNAGSLFSVAWLLQREGHEVQYLTIEKEESNTKIGEGLVPRIKKLSEIVDWNPDVAITYNSSEAGAKLAKSEIATWGSSYGSEELEEDRMFAGAVARQYKCGRVPRQERFKDAKAALKFLDEERARHSWVFKAEGRPGPNTTHVSDSDEQLRAFIGYEESQGAKGFVLQEKIEGLEISIEGWFDYRVGWLQPFNSTLERKKLMPGDCGPMTGCMGSVVWCWPGERPKLFRQTLEGLTPYLKQIRYVGPIDGNFIIDYKTREPNWLEFTPRFGWDAFEALSLLGGGWGDFFIDLGRGQARYVPAAENTFGMAVRIYDQAAPDVPLWAPLEWDHRVFPKDLYRRDEQLFTVGSEVMNGFTVVFEVGATGHTLSKARAEVYEEVMPQITGINDMIWRDDIGEQAEEDLKLLDRWGYLVQRGT